ncbi:amino acid permease, partial [bacterium]|nr:amino acid permease [bacterium]
KIKDLVGIGLGMVIGSGIFVTAGLAASGGSFGLAAGPAVMVSFVAVAFACLFCVLCYAEFSSILPTSGSAYTYAYATFGEYAAWFMGLNLILEYMFGNIAVSISWSGYLSAICEGLGFHVPAYLVNSYFSLSPESVAAAPHVFGIPLVMNLPAFLVNFIIAFIIIRGIRQSSTINNIIVIFKVGIVLFLICLGAWYVNPDNWHPFCPNGLAGIQAGAAFIFFSYIGFDGITTVAEECENPRRDLPLSMIITLGITALLYVAVAAVLTGMVPYTELGTSKPMATAFEMVNAPWAAMVISVGALVAMTAVLFVFLISLPRVLFVMSRDGMVPEFFGKVHKKYGTPHIATVIDAFIIATAAGLMDLGTMVELCNVGALCSFIFVCIGIVILRYTRPDLKRPFKTPLVPWVPLGGILCCLYLMLGLSKGIWIPYIIYLFLGTMVYVFYGYSHSSLRAAGQSAAAAGALSEGGSADKAEAAAVSAVKAETAASAAESEAAAASEGKAAE